MSQRELFDADRLTTTRCPVCGATREPAEEKAPACSVDRDRDAGVHQYRRRPVGCLNAAAQRRHPRMSDKRWWEFGLFDVVWCVGCLTVLYWIFGPPTTLFGWLAVAPSLLLGSWISHRFRARGNRG